MICENSTILKSCIDRESPLVVNVELKSRDSLRALRYGERIRVTFARRFGHVLESQHPSRLLVRSPVGDCKRRPNDTGFSSSDVGEISSFSH